MHPPIQVFLSLAGLLLFGVLIQVFLKLPAYAVHPDILHGDAYDYHTAARWLYTEHFRPHPTRMFGFPLIAGWITVWDSSFEAFWKMSSLLNVVFWLLTGLLLLRIGGKLFGAAHWLSYVPLLFFGLQIGNAVMVTQAVTETLFTFLLVLSLWLWLLFAENRSARYLLTAFGVFCFSLVIRPTASVWLLLMIPALFVFFGQRKDRFWTRSGIVLACLAATIGLQSGLMKAYYGVYNTSNIGLLTYYLYTDAYANVAAQNPAASWHDKGEFWLREYERRQKWIGIGPNGVVDIADWPAARDTMAQQCRQTWSVHKKELLVSYGRNLVSNTVSGTMIVEFLAKRCDNEAVRQRARYLFLLGRLENTACTLAAFLLALWTLSASFRQRKWPDAIQWVSLFSVSIIVLSAVSFAQGDRFHMVVAPLTGVAFSYQLLVIRYRFSGKN